MDVFFPFPGRVFDCFYLLLRSEQTKNPTGQKSFVCFRTFRGDTEFRVRVSTLFLIVFQGAKAVVGVPQHQTRLLWSLRGALSDSGIARRFAVCVENSVPVASGTWHAQVWVKVLAR